MQIVLARNNMATISKASTISRRTTKPLAMRAWSTRWFQEFLTKMANHPPEFPTERQTEQLLELVERIGSPTQIRKGALAECVR